MKSKIKAPFIVGIAGGSGAGKSTIAYALKNKYPGKISILRFDDYHHEDKEKVLMYEGFRNWDDPACVDFDKLIADLRDLKSGKSVTVRTWGSHENPEYKETGKRKEITVLPSLIILVEGYLALFSEKARAFFDLSIFLDAPAEVRLKRRNKLKDGSYEGYDEKVLRPMHEKYVEPTKQYADHVFDTSLLEK